MKIGYSTWGMPTVSADDAIESLARIGFDAFEITVIPGYSTELDTLDPAERQRIRQLIARSGLELTAIAGHRSLIATDPAEHAEHWRRLTGAVDLAVDLAGPSWVPVLDTTGGGRPDEWDDIKGRLVDRTGELCRYAAGRGVVVAMEPHVHSALNSIDRVLWLLDKVGSPALKVAFDISHFNVQGVHYSVSVPALAKYSVFTHVKDERGVAPDFEFLIPGEGEFDYVGYLRAMHAAGYTRDITVEVSMMVQRRPHYDPIAAAEQSYRVLSAAFADAGVPRG